LEQYIPIFLFIISGVSVIGLLLIRKNQTDIKEMSDRMEIMNRVFNDKVVNLNNVVAQQQLHTSENYVSKVEFLDRMRTIQDWCKDMSERMYDIHSIISKSAK